MLTIRAHATHAQVEATVLMHICTVLKYDSALGKDWLKHIQNGGLQRGASGGGATCSPFGLQVLCCALLCSALLCGCTLPWRGWQGLAVRDSHC